MSTTPAERRPPSRVGTRPPAPATAGWFRRLVARIGAAVRAAHSASVPF